jgi:hypothetical protein
VTAAVSPPTGRMIHPLFLGPLVAEKGKTGISATCLIIAIIGPPRAGFEPIGRTSSKQHGTWWNLIRFCTPRMLMLKTVESRGVVHEDFLADPGIGRPHRELVKHAPVVDH